MYPYTDPTLEVRYRQQQVQRDYVESQRFFSITGLRQVVGNSIIAMGASIHGMAQGACAEAAETRALVRTINRVTPSPR